MGFDEEIDPTLVGDPAIFGKRFKNKECELLIKLEKTGTNKIIDEVLEEKRYFSTQSALYLLPIIFNHIYSEENHPNRVCMSPCRTLKCASECLDDECSASTMDIIRVILTKI